ncbi:MAG: glycerophosphoryl diester phosphodiesterase membrane domain-containing protein [Candidatus Dormibacteria bacterium]
MAEVPPPPPPPPPGWGAPPPGWGPPPPGWGPPRHGAGPPAGAWPATPATLPGSGRFRAQGVAQLLDAAFTLYRRNFLLIVAITAVARVPIALVQFLGYQLTGFSDVTAQLQQISQEQRVSPSRAAQQLSALLPDLYGFLAVVVAVALLAAFVVQPIVTAAMTRAVSDIYVERATSISAAYVAVVRRVASVIGATAIVFLVVLGIVVAAVAVLLLCVLAFGGAGAILLILIVPAAFAAVVFLSTRWLFAPAVVVIEGRTARSALRRSWSLVRGSSWRVFGITLLVGLITSILSSIIGGLLGVLTQFGDLTLQLALSTLAGLVANLLVQPIALIVVVLLYYDQRIRREAFDIEMLAATL